MKPEPLTSSGFFIVRTPLLPMDELLAWSEVAKSRHATEGDGLTPAVVEAQRSCLRGWLLERYGCAEALEALYVASPSLFAQRGTDIDEPDSKRGRKVVKGLTSYFVRMASRPTPFGLFAGTSVGQVGHNTHITIAARTHYRRHTRFDMEYLCLLAEALQQHHEIRDQTLYFPSTGLYRLGDRLHYAECRPDANGRSYHLVTVEVTDYLLATLERARAGATRRQLAEQLVADDAEVAPEEAIEFIDSVIDSQILLSDLAPTVTGPEPINGMLSRLGRCAGAHREVDTLATASAALNDMDADGIGLDPERYRTVARRLETLPAKVDVSKLWQVDLHKPLEGASLGRAVVDEVIKAAGILNRITEAGDTPLTRFAESFTERYEGAEVPLTEALDEERGVGFDTTRGIGAEYAPLLDGLSFPARDLPNVRWRRQHSYLLRRISESLRDNTPELTLTAQDLDKLEARRRDPLPDALAALVRISARSQDAIARGDFRVLVETVSGPSGAILLGRFCHGDPEIERYVRDHLAAEEATDPDALFAEIVHLPEERMGNVLLRPILREWEIPFLGQSGQAADKQIPITDLCVSVTAGRIVLRSQRLGCQVLPRLTCAHNYTRRSLGIYRFLCSLQAQGRAGALRWDWGPLADAPHLPRVVSGRVVLTRARWLVFADEIKQFAEGPVASRFLKVQEWRRRRQLPRWIVLTDFDNELPIDLDNVVAVETLVDLIRNRPVAILLEMFPPPDELWVRGPEGRFVSQFIVPLTKSAPSQQPMEASRARSNQSAAGNEIAVRRTFSPGARWFTVKLYAGTVTVDKMLTELVRQVVDRASTAGAVDRWFFVRFADPNWHLRLRLHGDPEAVRTQVLPLVVDLTQHWLDEGAMWRVQYDTYVREMERYGGPEGIELAEQIFHADSQAVLAVLEMLSGDEGAHARWQLAIRGADGLLSELAYDCDAKRALMEGLARSFADEFQVNSSIRRQLGTKFREHRDALAVLTTDRIGSDHWLAPGMTVLAQRNEAMRPFARELRARATSGKLTAPLNAIAGSLIHMHINRLLRSNHRAQEVALYFLLARHYDSLLAQGKTK